MSYIIYLESVTYLVAQIFVGATTFCTINYHVDEVDDTDSVGLYWPVNVTSYHSVISLVPDATFSSAAASMHVYHS